MAIMATDTHVDDYKKITGLIIRTSIIEIMIKFIITVPVLSYTK